MSPKEQYRRAVKSAWAAADVHREVISRSSISLGWWLEVLGRMRAVAQAREALR